MISGNVWIEQITSIKYGGVRSTDKRGEAVERSVRTNFSYDKSHKQLGPVLLFQMKG